MIAEKFFRCFKAATVVMLTAFAACTPQGASVSPGSVSLKAQKLDSISVRLSPSSGLHWPTFLTTMADEYLWGEGNHVYQLHHSVSGAQPGQINLPFLEGHDRLIAATKSPTGTLAFLDSAGHVTVHEPLSQRTWKFAIEPSLRASALAVAYTTVYFLLEAEETKHSSAVIAYDFEGNRQGQWGSMPADAVIQATLRGGGITSCPDGSIFYSYINSSRILRLSDEVSKDSRMGTASSAFRELSERDIRKAHKESNRQGSVGPLVKLGLGGTRVMSLFCSSSGLLLRQIAQPGGQGSTIELWDPTTESLLGSIPTTAEVLLALEGNAIILGTRSEDRSVLLERLRLEVGPEERS